MRKVAPLISLFSVAFLFGLALGDEDLYKFMPQGGRQLLVDVMAKCANCDDMVTIVTTKRTQDEWQRYFTSKQSSLKDLPDAEKKKGALANLTEKQIKTLVAYLAINMPMPKEKIPKETKNIKWDSLLPMDGRQFVIETCTVCHGIAVTVTVQREVDGWLNTFKAPAHSGIRFTDQMRLELANYLTINMPVPEDQIPPELKKPPEY